ncbi:ribosome-associated protein [Desulfuromusa kysingii]|uniref:Ribosome-associated protein n=1 Tax=Desulfuromusa kysingii TaxID=37625 RepID=A0A1H3VY14_9BACT|nr:ribosome biogenesis factor YjgA [Desulfuromusa kysingii]SDZ79686.1 ribosome-associated protein [Desulfuromusa kysingii]
MDEFAADNLPLSRTKKKQQAKQIEEIAAQITNLTDKQFAQLDLPVEIAKEAELARTTKGLSSQRRQLKHLAGMIRKSEGALDNLLLQLEGLDQVSRGEKKQFHQLEKLRDRLCDVDSFAAAFAEMLELMPDIDRNTISRLARSVQHHDDRRAYRDIFRRLRDQSAEK